MRPSLWFFISLPPNFTQILDVCGLPLSLILVSRKKYNFEYIFFGCRRVQKRKDLTNRFDVTDDRTFNQVDEVVNVLDRYTVCLTHIWAWVFVYAWNWVLMWIVVIKWKTTFFLSAINICDLIISIYFSLSLFSLSLPLSILLPFLIEVISHSLFSIVYFSCLFMMTWCPNIVK